MWLRPLRCVAAAQVAGKMGGQAQKYDAAPESHADIKRSCREARLSYHDPTIMHRLNLQVAIAEERFDDACMCAGCLPLGCSQAVARQW